MGAVTAPILPDIIVNGDRVDVEIVTEVSQGDTRTILILSFAVTEEPWVALCEYEGSGAGQHPLKTLSFPVHVWTMVTESLVSFLE